MFSFLSFFLSFYYSIYLPQVKIKNSHIEIRNPVDGTKNKKTLPELVSKLKD